LGAAGVTSQSRNDRVAKHADAIRTLIRPDFLIGLFCVGKDGRPFFITPAWLEPAVKAALEGYLLVVDDTPEST
jgi:hypothetical protein